MAHGETTTVRSARDREAMRLAALLKEGASLDGERFLEGPSLAWPPSLAGQALGAWILETEIGQGGMGSLWLARRADGRYEGKAAVKLLNLRSWAGRAKNASGARVPSWRGSPIRTSPG
jgi:hypothetical protein